MFASGADSDKIEGRRGGPMRWGWLYTAMIATLLVSGCVVNEPEAPTRGVVVSGPPPAPVREELPPQPTPQSVWVPGYWHWTGMQYAWIPGHWDSPPPGSRTTSPSAPASPRPAAPASTCGRTSGAATPAWPRRG